MTKTPTFSLTLPINDDAKGTITKLVYDNVKRSDFTTDYDPEDDQMMIMTFKDEALFKAVSDAYAKAFPKAAK